MKILVLSDSHASLRFMRACVAAVKPQAVVHLGDHFDDGQVIVQENPHIPVHQVPGNCDRYRMLQNQPEVLCYDVAGARLMMTHGHRHNVKMTLSLLLADARRSRAAAVLYGHTHIPDVHREEDGLWVINPGACGYGGGSAAVLRIENGTIETCELIGEKELEEML